MNADTLDDLVDALHVARAWLEDLVFEGAARGDNTHGQARMRRIANDPTFQADHKRILNAISSGERWQRLIVAAAEWGDQSA